MYRGDFVCPKRGCPFVMSETIRKISEWFVWRRVKIVFKMKANLSNKITHIALADPSTCTIAVLRDRFCQYIYISPEITYFRVAFLPSLLQFPRKFWSCRQVLAAGCGLCE